MALPIMAPAATPPRIPAPTAQPTQSAFAGAATAAKPNAAAAARPTSDLCMCFPHVIGRVPIWDVDRRESPKPPNSRRTRRNSTATLWRKLGAENFASERRSTSERLNCFLGLACATGLSDAGANPSVAVPYTAPRTGRRIGIRCVIAIVAVWIVGRRRQWAADGGPKRKAAETPTPAPAAVPCLRGRRTCHRSAGEGGGSYEGGHCCSHDFTLRFARNPRLREVLLKSHLLVNAH